MGGSGTAPAGTERCATDPAAATPHVTGRYRAGIVSWPRTALWLIWPTTLASVVGSVGVRRPGLVEELDGSYKNTDEIAFAESVLSDQPDLFGGPMRRAPEFGGDGEFLFEREEIDDQVVRRRTPMHEPAIFSRVRLVRSEPSMDIDRIGEGLRHT